MDIKDVFVAWQDPKARTWHTVGHLACQEDKYTFHYTQGAKASKNFVPFDRMESLEKVYSSKELFPIFSNRILPKNRPEYKKYIEWLDLDAEAVDSLSLLAVSGGEKVTDQIRIIPTPNRTRDGFYSIRFFIHGLRHLPEACLKEAEFLSAGDQLLLMEDIQNKVDENAVAVRTGNPKVLLGYFPHYLNRDVRKIISDGNLQHVVLRVVKVNNSAPLQYRYLCQFEAKWPEGFIPHLSDEYLPLNKVD